MKWDLEVEFGGLCMFVVRPGVGGKDPKLVVLMPQTSGSMKHEPTLEFGEKGTGKFRASLDKVDKDFTTEFGSGSGSTKLPDEIANVSSFVSNKPVKEQCLSGALSGSGLTARFVFPIGSSVSFESGSLKARMHPRDNPSNVKAYCGRATVSVKDIDGEKQKIKIGDVTLFRLKQHPKLAVRLLNVMQEHLDCPRVLKHDKGEKSEHFHHYYSLIEGDPPGPDLIFDDENAGETDCRDERVVILNPHFVDPFNCTIGGGCPPEVGSC